MRYEIAAIRNFRFPDHTPSLERAEIFRGPTLYSTFFPPHP